MGGNWHPPRRHRLLSNTVWCPCPGYYGKWLSLGQITLLSLIIWSKLQLHSGGSWEGTFAPQVVAIYADTRLDPESKTAIEFSVDFDHGFSTVCIEDIHCDLCDKAQRKASNEVPSDCSHFVAENLANISQETFFKENTTWPYQTKLDYRCPPGKAFELQDASGSPVNSITVECGWDTTWTWDPLTTNGQLPACKCKKWIESFWLTYD